MNLRIAIVALLAATGLGAEKASALSVPYTEEFAAGVAGWEGSSGDPLVFEGSGGPDSSSHASTSFNYFGYSSPFGAGPVLFRANDSDGASGDAFVGDWIAGGVQQLSVWVFHDTPESLSFYLRVAVPTNFPGAVIANPTLVAPNTWTELVFPIDPGSSLCTGETITCAQALASVGNLQFGTSAPAALAALDESHHLAIDRVAISNVPEPATGSLLALGVVGLAAASRGRTRGRPARSEARSVEGGA